MFKSIPERYQPDGDKRSAICQALSINTPAETFLRFIDENKLWEILDFCHPDNIVIEQIVQNFNGRVSYRWWSYQGQHRQWVLCGDTLPVGKLFPTCLDDWMEMIIQFHHEHAGDVFHPMENRRRYFCLSPLVDNRLIENWLNGETV